ncbi:MULTISPECIES: MarR family winged helix-turn-helix transcriptional regulator [Comamonas]|uniref:MarR family winged helix-turn-helix transcriptional regulator n=1 Tax=Comamonas TaxID=283 RepID=UPI0006B93789|nr:MULTISPECIES: MarR family winged helix-turn-helix transcriptional regulator [Comamonas]QOQ81732.1 winged helix-turn-helix transcriptional regulator [Comamonas thiooxydans]
MLAHKTAEPDSKPARSWRGTRSREVGSDLPGSGQEPRDSAEVFAVDQVDASFLESLLGYNARRASLALVGVFMRCMERFDLKIVEFSVLSLVGSNPGITSRQLCQQLAVLPPNMVGMIDALGKRGFLERRPHPRDGRATGLYLTAAGRELVDTAEPELKSSETRAIAHLSAAEQVQLMELLQKLYR